MTGTQGMVLTRDDFYKTTPIEQLQHDPDSMAKIRIAWQACLDGKFKSWSQVKKELGL